ncbi:DUF1772 domain-containing protein [Cognatiyoonia sp. IB215446]|uniref:DUF1772 domain-containing protein n=1 Tax=Cognatiyoonia sp. IB215446 TaxID=3097355 RepID=UPI002A179524|nr:DUF1772 domain-containing protein [Cognatiyoonia sp. IB215446]MDX8350040.1 DUF1772 domain-containing protein [Cognatiyoonia sp. IB215446]
MKRFEPSLQLIALLGGAVTFGTAYYLMFLAHPAWSAAPFEAFLPVFQGLILKIGGSQIIVSDIALVASVTLFFVSKDWFWLIAVALLLVSLPVTMYLLMPINFQFIEATDPDLASKAPVLLKSWGQYQIIRTIADGLAFVAMCKPVIWPKQTA